MDPELEPFLIYRHYAESPTQQSRDGGVSRATERRITSPTSPPGAHRSVKGRSSRTRCGLCVGDPHCSDLYPKRHGPKGSTYVSGSAQTGPEETIYFNVRVEDMS